MTLAHQSPSLDGVPSTLALPTHIPTPLVSSTLATSMLTTYSHILAHYTQHHNIHSQSLPTLQRSAITLCIEMHLSCHSGHDANVTSQVPTQDQNILCRKCRHRYQQHSPAITILTALMVNVFGRVFFIWILVCFMYTMYLDTSHFPRTSSMFLSPNLLSFIMTWHDFVCAFACTYRMCVYNLLLVAALINISNLVIIC